MLAGIVAFGVITGVAMVASGIAPLVAMLMSIIVFAGASMVAAAVVAAATVVAGNALPLKLSIPLAALAGIGAGLAFERSWR